MSDEADKREAGRVVNVAIEAEDKKARRLLSLRKKLNSSLKMAASFDESLSKSTSIFIGGRRRSARLESIGTGLPRGVASNDHDETTNANDRNDNRDAGDLSVSRAGSMERPIAATSRASSQEAMNNPPSTDPERREDVRSTPPLRASGENIDGNNWSPLLWSS